MRRLRVRSPSAPLASLKSEAVHRHASEPHAESVTIRLPTLRIQTVPISHNDELLIPAAIAASSFEAVDYNSCAQFRELDAKARPVIVPAICPKLLRLWPVRSKVEYRTRASPNSRRPSRILQRDAPRLIIGRVSCRLSFA